MGYKEDALDFLGITEWHKQGYTGKGIKILSDEKVCSKIHPDVISPAGFKSNSGHGDRVMSHIKLVAPDATFIAYPFNGTFTSSTYKCNCAEYIKSQGVHVFTTSETGSYPNAGKQKAIKDCLDAGCIFFGAAGNENKKGVNEETKYEGYFAIGGVRPKFTDKYNGKEPIYDWDNFHKTSYSSIGEELDYVTIAEILGIEGTSHCSPVFAAMIGLVQQFFIEKAGRALTYAEMILFINDNLLDIDVEGFDVYTGYGLLRLPKPETIKISRYVTDINVGDPIYYGGFPEVRSDVEMRGIDKLHPELQVCVNKFLAECKKQGLNVLVTETLRTLEEQEELYAQGRTKPGKIVTNCKGFESPHCWGVSFDFCRNEKGREYDNTDGFFEFVGEIAKTIFDGTEYDLFWGGDFKSFVDKPHIEMIKYLPNNSTKWLIDTYGTPEKFMKTWEVEKMEEVSAWAQTAWNWCKEKGYLDGTNPKGTVTREMLAQVLFNLFGKDDAK